MKPPWLDRSDSASLQATIRPWLSATFAVGCPAILYLGGCITPNQARARLGPATIPAEYHSPDGQCVMRLRGGTPATYELVRVQDGRVLGRAESAIWGSDVFNTSLTAYTVIRFYHPRSKQARDVSLESVHATDKPATQE